MVIILKYLHVYGLEMYVCMLMSDSLRPYEVGPPGSSVPGILQARTPEPGCDFLLQGCPRKYRETLNHHVVYQELTRCSKSIILQKERKKLIEKGNVFAVSRGGGWGKGHGMFVFF